MFDQQEPIVDQVERDMLPVAEAEHLDVADADGAAGGRDVAGWRVQDAVVCSGERAFFDGDVAGDVKGVDLDVCVGEGGEPVGEELGAGLFPWPPIPPGAR